MMPIAAAVVSALGLAMKYLVGRVLLALGLQMVFVGGSWILVQEALGYAADAIGALPPEIFVIVKATGVLDAVAVMGSAILVASILQMSRIRFAARG